MYICGVALIGDGQRRRICSSRVSSSTMWVPGTTQVIKHGGKNVHMIVILPSLTECYKLSLLKKKTVLFEDSTYEFWRHK